MGRPAATLPLVISCLAAACALVGCATGGDPVAGTGEHPGDGADLPQEMIDRVISQAASEAAVEPASVRVVIAEVVTWRDGSVGCPQPGQVYTQALVPGYRVVVDVGGKRVHYHASDSGKFTACANPQDPANGGAADS